ncbi:MAG: hypothetical protein R6V12_08195 [Candidatus Hydrogenedentota bacterium]
MRIDVHASQIDAARTPEQAHLLLSKPTEKALKCFPPKLQGRMHNRAVMAIDTS